MANKSFVVQYLVKAREQYVAVAAKVKTATRKLREEVRKTREEMARNSRGSKELAVSTRRLAATTATSAAVTGKSVRATTFDMQAGARAARNWGLGVAAAAGFALNSFKNAARDAQETKSKFEAVFSGVGAAASASAKNLTDNYGLARTAAQQLLADTGDVLTGFGFGQDAALGLSSQVATLAVDLASFTNYAGGAEGASSALTKAMLGEREMLKSLGIAISEAAVETKIKKLMSEGATFTSLRQAKAQATLAIAVEQSKNAIGDFNRTQKELANQERITSSVFQNMKTGIGEALLPMFLLLNRAAQAVFNTIDGFSPTAKRFIAGAAVAAAVVGALAVVIGGVALALPALTTAFAVFGSVASFAFWPVLAAVAALSAAAYFLRDDWGKAFAFLKGLFGALSTTLGPTINRVVASFREAAGVIAQLFGGDSEAYNSLAEFSNLGELIGTVIGKTIDIIVRGISGVGAVLGQLLGAVSTLDFGQFDVEAIKAEFTGARNAPAAPAGARVDVGVNVGLDQGLKQTSAASVAAAGARRTDIGVMAQ